MRVSKAHRHYGIFCLLFSLFVLFPATPVSADLSAGQSTTHQISADGTLFIPSAGLCQERVLPDVHTRDDILWRSVHSSIIGSSVGFNSIRPSEHVLVGHQNGAAVPIEVFDATGDGSPFWTYNSAPVQVASRSGVYAAVAYTEGVGLKIFCWDETLAAPLWEKEIGGALPAGYSRTFYVSRDGQRIALGCFLQGQVHLYVLDASNGAVLVDADIQLGNPTLRNLDISDTAEFVDLNCGATHVIYDVNNNVERARVNVGASTNVVAISESGDWIVSGFTTAKAWEWDAGNSAYVLRYTKATGGHYAGTPVISDRGFWMMGWYSSSYNHNRFQCWDLNTGTLLWGVDLPYSAGSVQDLPVAADVSLDRSRIAYAMWGDEGSASPEIVVFSDTGEILFECHATGSMYDVAISDDGHYVSATGKLVHANTMGSGSDTYCAFADPMSSVEIDEIIPFESTLTASPNPFRDQTRLSLSNPASATGPGNIQIIDCSGRCVRQLGAVMGKTSSGLWDGKNDQGVLVPAGVYYCRSGKADPAPLRLVRID